jgi:acetyl esterase/lipase
VTLADERQGSAGASLSETTSLLQAGVQCELHVWPGGFHGFDAMAPQAALSQTACTTRAAWIRRLLTAG